MAGRRRTDRSETPRLHRWLIGAAIVAVFGLGLLVPSILADDRIAPTETTSNFTTTTTDPFAVHSPRPGIVLFEPAQVPTEPVRIPDSDPRGADIHVDSGAADGGDGTAEQPYASITDAIEVAAPGDTVRVASGTYREYLTTVRAGRAEAPIRIVGDGMPHIDIEDLDPTAQCDWPLRPPWS